MAAAQKKKRSSSAIAWMVVSIIAVVAVGSVLILFSHFGKPASPTASPTTSASATPSSSSTPTPTASAQTPDQIREAITSIIASNDPSSITPYLAANVTWVAFGSDGASPVLTAQAATTRLIASMGTEQWGPTDNATIAQWQSGAFSQYFPAGSMQFDSSQDHFLSIVFDSNMKITQVVYGVGASLD